MAKAKKKTKTIKTKKTPELPKQAETTPQKVNLQANN